jgi:hypothetical protein
MSRFAPFLIWGNKGLREGLDRTVERMESRTRNIIPYVEQLSLIHIFGPAEYMWSTRNVI